MYLVTDLNRKNKELIIGVSLDAEMRARFHSFVSSVSVFRVALLTPPGQAVMEAGYEVREARAGTGRR